MSELTNAAIDGTKVARKIATGMKNVRILKGDITKSVCSSVVNVLVGVVSSLDNVTG